MKVLKFHLVALLLIQHSFLFSQAWVIGKEPVDSFSYKEVKIDRLDNIIATTLSKFVSISTTSSVLVKFDKFGNELWKKTIYCQPYNIGGYYSGILSHTTDKDGNIYMLSTNIRQINDSIFTVADTSNALSKFDANGRLQWIKKISSSFYDTDLTCDSTYNLFMVLQSDKPVFKLLDSTYTFPASPNNTRLFVARIDTTGKLKWTQNFSTRASNSLTGHLSISQNRDVMVTGVFLDTINITGTKLVAPTISGTIKKAAFAVLLTENGNAVYVKKVNVSNENDFIYRNTVFDNKKSVLIYHAFDTSVAVSPTTSSLVFKDSLIFLDASGEIFRKIAMNVSKTNRFVLSGIKQKPSTNNFYLIGNNYNTPSSVYPALGTFQFRKYDSSGLMQWKKELPLITNFKSSEGSYFDFGKDITAVNGYISTTAPGSMRINNSIINSPGSKFVSFISALKEDSNVVSGKVYYDLNNNNQFDSTDQPAAFQLLKTNKQNLVITDANGFYSSYFSADAFADTIITPLYNVASPASFSYTLSKTDSTITNQDIKLHTPSGINDLQIKLTPVTQASYSSQAQIRLQYKNAGSTLLTGNVTLRLSPFAVYQSSSKNPSFSSADSIVWTFIDLKPFETKYIDVFLKYNSAPLNTLVETYAAIYPVINDSNSTDNVDTLTQSLSGSYSPVNIISNPINILNKRKVMTGKGVIDYIINFENSNVDTVHSLQITNNLSPLSDLNSLQILDVTHFVIPSVNGRTLQFLFPNINLPNSNTNKINSRGAIHFRINVKANLQSSDTINNAATLYFDYNNPVSSNTTKNYLPAPVPDTLTICANQSTAINSNISGSIFQWQQSNGGAFSNLINNEVFSGVNTATLKLNNISSDFYGYVFRCLADGIGSNVYTLAFTNSWTNAAGTGLWENPLNWSCNTIPNANTDVVINTGDVKLGSNASVRSLIVKPGANINVSPNYTLTITH